MATIGGNICNASPSADLVPCLIGLGATTHIAGSDSKKQISLEEFFKGPGQTILGRKELLLGIQVPKLAAMTGAAYMSHGIRGGIDCSIVGVAAIISLGQRHECLSARIVLGGVAPKAIRAKIAEAKLEGKKLDDKVIAEIGRIAAEETSPIDDVRSTADYRRKMVEVFTRKALRTAIARAL
jgi:carbon-monoxide dehydrogenase medium subunit